LPGNGPDGAVCDATTVQQGNAAWQQSKQTCTTHMLSVEWLFPCGLAFVPAVGYLV